MSAAFRRTVAWFIAAMIVAAGIVAPPWGGDSVEALSGSGFDPGYIISDERFFDSNAMSQAQVQAFLASMTPNCGYANGLPCLRDYVGLTNTRASSGPGLCSGYNSEGYESAARIIWRVGQACGINPQVLLATLQKEQGLITQSSPTENQYRIAMGYGCPDTAACDVTFYGFFNQIYSAAKQFRQYTKTSTSWRYRPGYVNIQYHPNAIDCAAPTVLIRNQATANLYNYTPYQPNAAALANLTGRGDGCSSYGNRNFWVHFNNWFGSSIANGVPFINAAYAAQGGSSGPLGAATSTIISINENGSGTAQAFVNGSIYWTPYTGARSVLGAYRDEYFRNAGAVGPMAWPTTDRLTLTVAGRAAEAQAFQAGSIYSSQSSGVFAVIAGMRDAYFGLNGASGVLGLPTSVEAAIAANGGGSGQSFENGSLYSTVRFGTRAVFGPIRTAYFARGGASGELGWPISNVGAIAANGGGTAQAFQNGSIYSSTPGAFAVTGDILVHYFSLGGSVGTLGWPTGQPECSNGDCSGAFQGGTIYVSPSVPARVGLPAIEQAYLAAGGETGVLGARQSGLIPIASNGGGTGQVFANGSIYSTTSLGAFAVHSGIRDFYFSRGGAGGSLGWPIANQACESGGQCSQTFQGGTVYWTAASGGRIGLPAIESVYVSLGGASGALAARQSDLLAIGGNGGGFGQVYAGGSIYSSSSAGTYAVLGGIRSFYFTLGGSSGSLGWPVSAQVCASGGASCSQSFQGGTVYWSQSSGGRIGLPQIEELYSSLGGAGGSLGSRQSALIPIAPNGGGIGQVFAGGSIYSSPSAGTFAVQGGILTHYFRLSGAAGALGWPTAAQSCAIDGSCSQAFQRGTIYWAASTGGRVGLPQIEQVVAALGGVSGVLGARQSEVLSIAANGGGFGQMHANGSVFASNAVGTFAVLAGVRAHYFTLGGAAGALGWPTAAAVCNLGNTACSQTFQGGSILWSASGGGSLQ